MTADVFTLPDRQPGQSDRDYHIASAPARLVDAESWRKAHLAKDRSRVDKRITLKEAVDRYVQDGDIVSDSGFTWVRGCIQATFEMIRQNKKDLTWMGAPMATAGIPTGAGIVKSLHNSYTGAEMRGIDRVFSRRIRNKQVEILSEWSHGAQALGFKAAQLGLPYVASKILLGSDMLKYNPYVKTVQDELRGGDGNAVCLIPALYPDVVFIHAQQADKYGNARIWGPVVNDAALAVAARKVIITCEEVVPEEEIRRTQSENLIPYIYVDAVVEMPYGNLPASCPGYYYWHREWWERGVRVSMTDDESFAAYLKYWIHDCRDHYDFVDKLGGGVRAIVQRNRLTRAAEGYLDLDGVDYAYPEVDKNHPWWKYPWEGGFEEELARLTGSIERLKILEAEAVRKEEKA
ncbi:MAG: CoA transferase subunit A [Solirubrobacterales bacterium]